MLGERVIHTTKSSEGRIAHLQKQQQRAPSPNLRRPAAGSPRVSPHRKGTRRVGRGIEPNTVGSTQQHPPQKGRHEGDRRWSQPTPKYRSEADRKWPPHSTPTPEATTSAPAPDPSGRSVGNPPRRTSRPASPAPRETPRPQAVVEGAEDPFGDAARCSASASSVDFDFPSPILITHATVLTPGGGRGPSAYRLEIMREGGAGFEVAARGELRDLKG
eukprot:Hpha_TRINITY_DN15309_c2_g1::TRINITY_DN15309_c2_g1_i1::g.88948::m.88948